ncbi:MAG: circadian clock KaiB family protein [Calditrichia bacterium]
MIQEEKNYVLKLFVSGITPRSMKALDNIKKICADHLEGRYHLEIVDIYQHPDQARKENVIAIPTLIRVQPAPRKKFIGDLSDTVRVLDGLEIYTD